MGQQTTMGPDDRATQSATHSVWRQLTFNPTIWVSIPHNTRFSTSILLPVS